MVDTQEYSLDSSCFPHLLKSRLFLVIFLRKEKNRSDSSSVQIISKDPGKYKVIKTIRSGSTAQHIEKAFRMPKTDLS